MINYNDFVKNSIDYLSNYIEDNNLCSLVIGISGGIDSTVTAAIASEACKKCKVPLIGRSLPAHSNDPEELRTAISVGEAFCDDFKKVAIERMYARAADEMELNEGKMTPLQLGNIKARLRMIYLYNIASLHRGCVLDTDNRTEHELGFWTIHGDVGDINCGIIHLWKTEVYDLSEFLADMYYTMAERDELLQKDGKAYRMKADAISESIELTPTDGNGVMSGGDCAQFGLDNYSQVDDVLKTLYFPEDGMDNIKYKNEYIRLIDTYNEQGVDKVMMLHQNSRFKREHMPIFPTIRQLGL